ncbi:hypothetical protein R6Z07M_011236 [Ovis aries]
MALYEQTPEVDLVSRDFTGDVRNRASSCAAGYEGGGESWVHALYADKHRVFSPPENNNREAERPETKRRNLPRMPPNGKQRVVMRKPSSLR